MKTHLLFAKELFAILALSLGCVQSGNVENFDFLVFAQVWPVTSCVIWEAQGSGNTCSLPSKTDKWTIHGVWPSASHGGHPFFCNKTLPFNENALSEIMTDLKERWADVHKNSPEGSFWKHEWLKHGTCAIQLEPLNTELKYFKQGLLFNQQYDITSILSGAGINPGSSYTGDDIMNAVQKTIKKWPAISCVKNDQHVSTEENLLLSQISICMDTSFNVIDCYAQKTYGGCSPTKPINSYPLIPHNQRSGLSGGTIFGLILVILILLGAGVGLFFCYRRNITRYRGYENI